MLNLEVSDQSFEVRGRARTVLTVISSDQTAYVKGKYIGGSVKSIH